MCRIGAEYSLLHKKSINRRTGSVRLLACEYSRLSSLSGAVDRSTKGCCIYRSLSQMLV